MYEKLQKVWVEETGLKIGDKVKVLRKFEDYEFGSSPYWKSEMYQTIGEIGEVIEINTDSIKVNFGDDRWLFPFRALEKVEIPDTCRDVLFLSRENEWEVGFYCSGSGCWEVRGIGLGFLRLADGEVKKWKELPNKEK